MKLAWEDLDIGPVIGRGTVGDIYSGRMGDPPVDIAVKVLQAAISDEPLVRARFRREVEILERLNHPHIIHYYGNGCHDDRLFYVMERLNGGTVRDLLERFGALSWMEVASIGRQVCSALQHAHNHGIIHRDLKPSNLFLTEKGEIKLGDFGIAHDTHSADLTGQGLTVGTHAYMAPEQITAQEVITGKADLYSLGCTLFELLTARKPFEGANFAVLFEQHLHQPAPSVSGYVTGVPSAMVDLIGQLLEKNPDKRPFNARQVQGVFLQLLDANQRSVTQAPSSSLEAHPDDVAAAGVVDQGMVQLARKVTLADGRSVSWKSLTILVMAMVIVVLVAVLVNR